MSIGLQCTFLYNYFLQHRIFNYYVKNMIFLNATPSLVFLKYNVKTMTFKKKYNVKIISGKYCSK